MINSVYDVLNSYRSQGRLNVKAALKGMQVEEGVTEDKLRSISVDAKTEFMIDCFAVVNEEVGSFIGKGKSKTATWAELTTMVDKCIERADSYWKSHGWTAPRADYFNAVKRYIIECVWLHLTGGSGRFESYTAGVESYGRGQGMPEDVIKELCSNRAIFWFLPSFMNGIDTMAMSYMWSETASALSGFRVMDEGGPAVRLQSEYLDFYMELFVVKDTFGDSGFVSNHFIDTLAECNPEWYAWMCDPMNISLCTGAHIFGALTRGAVYLWSTGGSPINTECLPRTLIRDLLWECRGLGGMMNPPAIYNGVKQGTCWLCTIRECTDEIYSMFGYNKNAGMQNFILQVLNYGNPHVGMP